MSTTNTAGAGDSPSPLLMEMQRQTQLLEDMKRLLEETIITLPAAIAEELRKGATG